MVFTCSLCSLLPNFKGRKVGPGKCTLTDVNFDAACALLLRRWPQSTSFVQQLKLPAVLCRDCLPDFDRSQITTRTFGRLSETSFLVGQPAAQWLASQKVMKEGIVSDEPPADLLEGYVVKWSDGSQSQMTDEEAREACDMGRWMLLLIEQAHRPVGAGSAADHQSCHDRQCSLHTRLHGNQS